MNIITFCDLFERFLTYSTILLLERNSLLYENCNILAIITSLKCIQFTFSRLKAKMGYHSSLFFALALDDIVVVWH